LYLPTDLSPPDRLPADRAPDLSPERFPDLAPDLPTGRVPDLLPANRYPEVNRDLLSDRLADLVPDLNPDRTPDVLTDLLPDRLPDLLPPIDGSCRAGSTLPCTCDNGLQGSRICLPSHVYSECGCGTAELMRVRNGIIGTWSGTATTPWVDPYAVTFTFDSYSHYSDKSLNPDYSALYYGADEDSPLKRYDVTDMQANGDAKGTIDIVFMIDGPPGSSTLDTLEGIRLSADGDRLQFYVMHLGTYGPLQYELQRVIP
jgi:hypothetical protein